MCCVCIDYRKLVVQNSNYRSFRNLIHAITINVPQMSFNAYRLMSHLEIVKQVTVQAVRHSASLNHMCCNFYSCVKLTIACSILLSMATTLAPDALLRERATVITRYQSHVYHKLDRNQVSFTSTDRHYLFHWGPKMTSEDFTGTSEGNKSHFLMNESTIIFFQRMRNRFEIKLRDKKIHTIFRAL